MKTLRFDCVVIGSGAAGYNAACRLAEQGVKTAILTEGVNCGTSRNTGSDKQTYYKLGLASDTPDSVYAMAKTLFDAGCVDGDTALCEAALSVRSFLHLCELGVAFPVNRYGEAVGYKTDHDPFARATSAGPLTSRDMTEALEREAKRLEIPVIDGALAVELLKKDGVFCGLIAYDSRTAEYFAVQCADVVLCTGGPAGIYADSVYPACHTGSTGLALAAGARAQNLTEWQYGLASIDPRWNVSGTYMQVLPRFVAVDPDGTEHEFLSDYFADPYEALTAVFLKGYQWPFDCEKILAGSSVIDLLVYRECVMNKRRVFLDFTRNPFGLKEIDFEKLSPEARDYLRKAEAAFGTPIERLEKMNEPAIALYRSKGVDIAKEPLEIALCAQHNNGGLAVDLWWQTSVRGVFAAGECAGTHGISRPGGSALNAGQVGGLRAAQYIGAHPNTGIDPAAFDALAGDKIGQYERLTESLLGSADTAPGAIRQAARRMSDCAAALRDREKMTLLLRETEEQYARLAERQTVTDRGGMAAYFKLRDILLTQRAVLSAMIDYAEAVGKTRGSSLCYDAAGSLREGLDEIFRFRPEEGETRGQIRETVLTENGFCCTVRPVRPLPHNEDVFETVWKNYRQTGNIE